MNTDTRAPIRLIPSGLDKLGHSPGAIDGLEMSDFVYPAYFEDFHPAKSVKFDELGVIEEPFGLAPGGYHWTFADGAWKRVDGSPAKEQKNAARDRRGRRGAHRTKQPDQL